MGAQRAKQSPRRAEPSRAESLRQRSELRKKDEEVKRAEVGRLVRAGLTDFQAGKRLHLTSEKVAEHREALGLKANPRGGALD